MTAPLVADRWRGAAFGAAVAGALVLIGLGVALHHRASTGFDNWALRRLYARVGTGGARFLIDLSEPALTFGVLLAVAVLAGLLRRWRLVALTVLAPSAAVLLAEEVLKPLVGRLIGPYVVFGDTRGALPGAYPSGHETGVVAAAAVLLVAAGQLRLPAATRAAVVALLAAWSVLAALGLVRNFYHYATDTVGALGLSVAVVLGAALLIDRLAPQFTPRS